MRIYIGTAEFENFSVVQAQYYEDNCIIGCIINENGIQYKDISYFRIRKNQKIGNIYFKDKKNIEIYYEIDNRTYIYLIKSTE